MCVGSIGVALCVDGEEDDAGFVLWSLRMLCWWLTMFSSSCLRCADLIAIVRGHLVSGIVGGFGAAMLSSMRTRCFTTMSFPVAVQRLNESVY